MKNKLLKYVVLEENFNETSKYEANELIRKYADYCRDVIYDSINKKLNKELESCSNCIDTVFIDLEVFDEWNMFDDLDNFDSFKSDINIIQ